MLTFHFPFRRWTYDKKCNGTDFDKTLINVSMAGFLISMRTQRKLEVKSVEAIFKPFFFYKNAKLGEQTASNFRLFFSSDHCPSS